MRLRTLRLVRGWAGATAATSIAALSHFAAGGSAPEPLLLLLAFALSGLACTALTGRGLSLWRLAAGVVLSQALFHWLFSGSAVPHTTSAAHTAGHAHTPALPSGPGPVLSAAADDLWDQMWLGHAVAAILTVAILRHGEVTILRLVRAVRLRVTACLPLFRSLPVPPARSSLPPDLPVRPLRNLGVPLVVMRHRGPPPLPIVS